MNRAHRELQLPGARLRYRDEGAGRAVVFVHGWTLDLDVWEPQTPLAAELRVVRHDRRGFGLSSGMPSLAADVDDLRALLHTLALQAPLLVGMSQGARVVLEFVALHPDVASGLILDGPPPLAATGSEDPDLPMDAFRELAAKDGVDAFRRRWSTHPLTQLHTGDADKHALLARVLARYPGHDLTGAEVTRETIDAALLARVRTPTLIVNGARDTETRRRAGLALCAALPSAEHVTLPQAGHLPNLDTPFAYNQIVSGFARRHLTAAA
jgi:pimeloyl-ACP methyl ester carboxylesterase